MIYIKETKLSVRSCVKFHGWAYIFGHTKYHGLHVNSKESL